MKVRLAVSPERYEPLRAQLGAHGIEVDDSAELVLSETGRFAETLAVRERAGGVRALLPVEEIVSIETLGREVVVYARGRCWQTGERLYRLAARLDPDSPKDLTGKPSLVLRCLGKQETAWDLAKRYNTTIGVILAANQLEAEGDISRDQLLLIPRKRA